MSPLPCHYRRLPSASPTASLTTVAALLCLLLQIMADRGMASPSLPPWRHANPGVAAQHRFLREVKQTTPQQGHDAFEDQESSVMEETHEILLSGGHLSETRTSTVNDTDGETPPASAPPRPAQPQPPLQRIKRASSGIRRVGMHGPPLKDRRTLFVEAVMVLDHALYRHYRTHAAAHQRAGQVVGAANRVLSRVGVVLVLADVRIWDRGDEMSVTRRPDQTLENLMEYRLGQMDRRHDIDDHTVLFTMKKMRGETRRATVGGMCRKRESVSVLEEDAKGPGGVGAALAHHVGRSLGMEYDEENTDQSCVCSAATCVMSRHFRNASTSKLEWSSCSRRSLDLAMETLALDCLRNVPTRMFQARPSCGDGVVDEGEQCDCGPAEFCDNPCCIADTCRFAVNASCASGSCCDTQTCRPQPPGTLCRASFTDCDLPEFCSGHSEYCPADVTKADGASCQEGKGHCYRGECGSREGRCQLVWGPAASAAPQQCYSDLNIKGDANGNCGSYHGTYHRCSAEAAVCGTLHCLAPPSRPRYPHHRHNGSRRSGPHQCHFISGSRDYPSRHWLTPNGAPCASGKMCVNQRCVAAPGVTGDCLGGCSGRGVCNSLGHCHCDPGFAPPDCSLPGLGGSMDSGVMSDFTDNSWMITLFWVMVVLLLSLVAVLCCAWGFFKGWYKRRGQARMSQAMPCCVVCLDSCCCPVMTKITRWMLTVGSSQEKKMAKRNIDVYEEANEQMLCSVDVGIKSSSQTTSWGVANEKLVTDLVTITPKNSPDFRRKVKLPSDSPILYHKSVDNITRPKYLKSISTDSGCVSESDDDGVSNSSISLSMSSLLSTLRRFSNGSTKSPSENENRRSKHFDSQKSMPLSRFVVDPFAGGRSSRQGTPPPEHIRPPIHRSISSDVMSTRRNRVGTPPPPPPATLKPNKSEENLSSVSGDAADYTNGSRKQIHFLPDCKSQRETQETHQKGSAEICKKPPLRPPKMTPSPPKIIPQKHDSPTIQNENQQNQDTMSQKKPTPPPMKPHQTPRDWRAKQTSPSPHKTSSGGGLQDSGEGKKTPPPNGASSKNIKVMQMTRKFEAT